MEKDTAKLEANSMLLKSRAFILIVLDELSGSEEYICDINKCTSNSERRGFLEYAQDCINAEYKNETEDEEESDD